MYIFDISNIKNCITSLSNAFKNKRDEESFKKEYIELTEKLLNLVGQCMIKYYIYEYECSYCYFRATLKTDENKQKYILWNLKSNNKLEPNLTEKEIAEYIFKMHKNSIPDSIKSFCNKVHSTINARLQRVEKKEKEKNEAIIGIKDSINTLEHLLEQEYSEEFNQL